MKDKIKKKKKVKLVAKKLYENLLQKKEELFIVGWQGDPQQKRKVKK